MLTKYNFKHKKTKTQRKQLAKVNIQNYFFVFVYYFVMAITKRVYSTSRLLYSAEYKNK